MSKRKESKTKDNILEINNIQNISGFIDRPVLPDGTHPVETGFYLIATNMIYKLHREICMWIDNRTPGAMFYGRPRLGKTKAIEYINLILPAKYGPNIVIFHVSSLKHKSISEEVFFTHFLKQVKHKQAIPGKAYAKRDRLINYLIEKVESSGQNKLIIFIDDAQRYSELEYEWLMDIYNEIKRFDINTTFILVGQKELKEQRTAFLHARKAQIIGRFMVNEYEFKGAINSNDIKNCLIGYDIAEYPQNSGWTYTKYFFPQAYMEGHRLEECADEIYDVLVNIRRESNLLRKNFDIPMQYLINTIEYALRHFGANSDNFYWLSKHHWNEAIEKSGYINAELYNNELDEV